MWKEFWVIAGKELNEYQCDAERANAIFGYINNRRMLRRLKVAFVKQMWGAVCLTPAPMYFKLCWKNIEGSEESSNVFFPPLEDIKVYFC